MDHAKRIPLDEFLLDERIYDRSKQWSSFMQKTFERCLEDDDEYAYNEIDHILNNSKNEIQDSTDDLDSLDKSVDLNDEDVSEGDKDASNISVLVLRTFSNSLAHAEKKNYSKIVKNKMPKLIEVDAEDEEVDNDDIQNVVNETLPIFLERKRKWQESGMLHVLNTFDEKKIEEKVGNWLLNNSSRRNSTNNVSLLPYPQQIELSDKYKKIGMTKYPLSNYGVSKCAPDTEDESLHSMDTARYIRSNRKRRNGTTMNIKSFRLLQSKRNALRDKYSFPEDEEIEYQHNRIYHVHNRHKLQKSPISRLYRSCENKFEISLDSTDYGQQKNRCRRKVLNKRRSRTHVSSSYSTTDGYNDKTSDEEGFPENKSSIANGFRQKGSLSLRKCDSDERPKKRASECCCCKEIKLCEGIRHCADTSTEEWFVENCLTPKKAIREKVSKRHNKTSKTRNLLLNSIEKEKQEKLKIRRKRANGIDQVADAVFDKDKVSTETQKKSDNAESEIRKNDNTDKKRKIERKVHKLSAIKEEKKMAKKQKVRTKDTHVVKNVNEDVIEIVDSDFERDLKLAIQISKKIYDEEITKNTKMNTDKNPSSERKTKNKTLDKAIFKKKQKKSSTKEHKEVAVQVVEENINVNKGTLVESQVLKTLKENSLHRNNSLELMINEMPISLDSSAEKTLKPQPKSIKLKCLQRLKEKTRTSSLKGNITTTTNESFFSLKNANVYNSTAMKNCSVAIAKELSSSSSSSRNNLKSSSSKSDDTDCAVVSSTTCDTHSINNKGILLYTPKNPNLAPRQSISNGEFHLTEEHLSSIIGEKSACKFFKHHIGTLRFDANLSLFFRPPRNLNNIDIASDSDDDPLGQIGEHGQLYVSFNE